MKKIAITILSLIMILMISACGTASSLDVNETAEMLNSSVSFAEQLTKVSSNIEIKKYGIDEGLVTEAAGYCGTAAVVDEIAVFKTTDTKAVEEKVNEHIESQKSSYTSYAPNEVPKLDAAVVKTIGDCVVVCISNDSAENVSNVISGLSK